MRVTLIGGLFGLGAHGGFYGLFTWLPTYLQDRARHSRCMGTGGYLAVIIVAFGLRLHRRVAQLLRPARTPRSVSPCSPMGCVVVDRRLSVLPISGARDAAARASRSGSARQASRPAWARSSTSYTRPGVRGTGVGFCYNFGRISRPGFPVLIGAMSGSMSLGTAIGINACGRVLAGLGRLMLLPETQGRVLDGKCRVELQSSGRA